MTQHFIRTSKTADYLAGAVLALVPFHAFLTTWGSALVGHYTLLRLWNDAALLMLLGITGWWLAHDTPLRNWFTRSLLVRLILAYALLSFLLGFIALAKGDVDPKALAYGLLVNLRFLAWFLAVLLAARRSTWLARSWPRLLLIPAAAVVVFAALQYTVLPHNFLEHFGYRTDTTIAPIETINHNSHYIRVQSTLRGANPLGAYLVLVLSVLGTLFLRGKKKLVCGALGVVALVALYATGSRSGWIGALLGLTVVAWFSLRTGRARALFSAVTLGGAIVAVGGYLLLKDNVHIQNELLHTQAHSLNKVSSNDAHASAVAAGAKDVVHQPFGDGPGTAGPASVYNGDHPARIAEDYYVQVAQETGWLGLALFVGILALVGLELYQRIANSRLALALFASLVGISFVGLLSHVWTDDTLAFAWWGLAAVALATPPHVKTRETNA